MFKRMLLRSASVLVHAAPVILFGIFPVSQSVAGPQDGKVTAGSAQITTGANRVDIHQSTQRAVIDWRTFNIDRGETTQFHQPNSQSLTLNRVGTRGASQIDGNLKANGNIVIINPDGVFFGAGSKVDVNGLVATTSDIDNERFMRDQKLNFDKPGNPNAAIVNRGTITAREAGLVGLVAPNVLNEGVINVRLGRVHLASGDKATVDLYGNGLMEVQVSDEVKSQLVSNTGIINAEGGTIAITAAAAKNVVNSLVIVAGELHAPTVGMREGKIIIAAEGSNAVKGNVEADKGKKSGSSTVIVSGVLDVTGRDKGERGGSVEITGDNIRLLSGTVIDATGHSAKAVATSGTATLTMDKQVRSETEFLTQQSRAGGSIKIGGDYLGGGITPTAKTLTVDTGVYVFNDALDIGDGGRTIFWSDHTTEFSGIVYSRGGDRQGHGGFLETSGKVALLVRGFADLTAEKGSKGTYLLDPDKITIYGGVTPTFTSTDGTVNLASSLLFWLDATDASKVTLTYSNALFSGITVNGTQGNNYVTVSASVAGSLQAGARIRLGGAGSATTADVKGADTYTVASISGTTVYLTSALSSDYNSSSLYRGVATAWGDKSTGGHNATASGVGTSPLYLEASANGKAALFFDGVDDKFNTSMTLSGNFTIAATFNPLSVGLNQDSHLFGTASSSGYTGGFAQISELWNETVYRTTFRIDSGAYDYYTSGTSGIGYAGTSYGNKVTVANISNHPTSTNTFTIGNRFNGDTVNAYYGSQSEIIILNGTASTNVRNLIEQYQSAKYNIGLLSGTPATEASMAMDASTGYSAFSADYLERLSATADIVLQASNGITLDLKGDVLTLAGDRSISLTTTNGGIGAVSSGTIETTRTTTGGNITMTASGTGGLIDLSGLALKSNGGNINLTASGNITSQTIDTSGDVTITANGGTYTSKGKIGNSAALRHLTITALDVDLRDTIKGTGTLTLKADQDGRTLAIGAVTAQNFTLDATEIGRFQNGWHDIAIGRATGTGDIYVGTSSWSDDLKFLSNRKVVFASGGVVTTTDGAKVDFSSGWVDLYGTLNADGEVRFNTTNANGVLGYGGAVNTTNDDIYVNILRVTKGLALNAGTATVRMNGEIFQGAIHTGSYLNLTGGTIAIAGPVNAASSTFTLNSINAITLPAMNVGALNVTTSGATGDVTFNLSGGILQVAADGYLLVNSARDIIDSTSGYVTTSGNGYLTLSAAGAINLDNTLAFTAVDGATTLRSVGDIRLVNAVFTSGDGDVILNADRNGTGARVTLSGVRAETDDGDIIIGGGTAPRTTYVTNPTSYGITSGGSSFTTYSGDISLMGWHTSNVVQGGINLSGGTIISSTEGDILVDGKATNQIGLVMTQSSRITNKEGDIVINAYNGNNGGLAFNNWGNNTIESIGSGDIHLNMLSGYYYGASAGSGGGIQRVGSDQMTGDIFLNTLLVTSYMDGAAYQFITQGTLTVSSQPGRRIILGDSAMSSALILSNAMLNNLHASAYVFGSEDSGGVTVQTTRDFGDAKVSFISGQDINLASTLTKATGNAIVDYLFQADGNIYNSNEADILANSGGINLTFNADRDQATAAGGAIKLTGANIVTGGGDVIMGGGLNPLTGYALGAVDGTYDSGIYFNGVTITSGAGDITLSGKGDATGADNYGLNLIGGGFWTTTGDILINAIGGTSGTANNYGIRLRGGPVFSTTGAQDGEGDITLNAQGGSSSTAILACNNNGCADPGYAATFNTVAGDILMNVNSPASGERIEFNTPVSITTQSGDVTLRTTGSITGLAMGEITTESGDVTFQADSDGISGGGINLTNLVVNTTSGDVVFGGGTDARTGYAKGTADVGIRFNNVDVTTGSGSVIAHGEGEDTGSYNYGLYLYNGTVFTTDSGSIQLDGKGGNGTDRNYGINLEGGNSLLTQSGAITLKGQGRGNGERNYGMEILGTISSLGSIANPGDITLTGVSATSTTNSRGIQFSNTGLITTVNADVYLYGEGAQLGIHFDDGGRIYSYGMTADAGNITLEGIANGATGGKGQVNVSTSTLLETQAGNITLRGTTQKTAESALTIDDGAQVWSRGGGDIMLEGYAPNSSLEAVYIANDNTQLGHADMTGDITITGDSLYLSTTTTAKIVTQGKLTVQPRSADRAMFIGTESTGLSLSEAELTRMTAGAYVFGSTISGDLTVRTGKDFADADVSFLSGRDIHLYSTLTKATGSAFVDYLFQADRDIYNSNSAGIVASTGAGGFHLTLNSDYDQATNPTGNIRLNGGQIASHGGDVIMGGGTDPRTQYAQGNPNATSGYLSGIDLRSLTISSDAGDILLNGRGATTASNIYGIQLIAVAFQTTTGDITLNGIGGTTGTSAVGLRLMQNTTFTTTGGDGTGNVTINAQAGSGSTAALWFCNNNGCTATGNSAIISTVGGDVAFNAVNGANHYITADNPISVTTQTGDVTFRANGGVFLNNGGTITTQGGDVIFNSDRDQASSPGGSVKIVNAAVTTHGGDFIVGGGLDPRTMSARGDQGIILQNSDISTDDGDILLHGKGGTASGQLGIYLKSTDLLTTTGDIEAYGYAGTGASGTSGLNFESSTTITDSGTIKLYGETGGAGSNSGVYDRGIYVSGGTIKANTSGDIILTAKQGAASTATSVRAIQINSGALIESNTGDIEMYTEGGQYGVVFWQNSTTRSIGGGNMLFDTKSNAGTAAAFGTSTDAASNYAYATIGGAGTKSITVIADTYGHGGNSNNMSTMQAGTITIKPKSTGLNMSVGTAVTDTLNVNAVVLNRLTADDYIFGSTETGSIFVNTARNYGDSNLSFISGNNIRLDANLTKSSGTAIVDYLFQANGNITNANNSSITANSGGFNLTLNADRDQATNPGGRIQFTGGSIISGGGDVVMGGGTDPRTMSAIGLDSRGVAFYGGSSTISTGVGDIIINGRSSGTTNQMHGILLGRTANDATPLLQTTSGDIFLNGSSDIAAANAYGVFFDADNYVLTVATQTGDIGITGIGSPNASSLGAGIRFKDNVHITSVDGDITLTAYNPSGAGEGINITEANNLLGGAGHHGDITIIADSWTVEPGVLLGARTTGKLTIQNYSVGAGFGIGSAAAGDFRITDTALAQLHAGSYVFGSATAGDMEIGTDHIFTAPVTFFTGAGNDIILNDVLSSSVSSGTALTLASGGAFINHAGTSALQVTSGGRWLVYSSGPADNLRGGLMPTASLFGKTYAANGPDSLTGTAGNLFLYQTTTRPVLNMGVRDVIITYGNALGGNALLDYVSGLVGGDSLSDIGWDGIAALVAAGYQPTWGAGTRSGAVTASAAGYVSPLGYILSFGTADLRIQKAVLDVTLANPNPSRGFRSLNPFFALSYSGWKNGEGPNALVSAPVAYTNATLLSPVGFYTIMLNGGAAANYTFHYPAVAGQLQVLAGIGEGFVLPETVSKTSQSNWQQIPAPVETFQSPAGSSTGEAETDSPEAHAHVDNPLNMTSQMNGLLEVDPRLALELGLDRPFSFD